MNLLFLFFINFTQAQQQPANIEFLGRATHPTSNVLLYIERHRGFRQPDGSFTWISSTYEDPKGNIFARKSSIFNQHRTIPEHTFTDSRFKLSEKSTVHPSLLKVEIERTIDGKTKTGSIAIKENSVAGQGFHNFIVKNFEKLKIHSETISFILIPKMDEYSFRISLDPTFPSGEDVRFKVNLKNFLLRSFVSPIFLSYNSQSKKLLEFKGLSNLDDSQGRSQEVLIKYQY